MYRKINFWGLPTRIVQICKRSANFDEPRATTFAKYFPFLDIGFRKDWVGGHVYEGVQNWPKVWMWSLPQTVVVHGIKLLVQFPPQTWNLSRPALVNFFFFKLCWFFQENSGFPCKVFRNMKFTLLFGEFTHNFSPKSLLKFYIVISISTKRDQNHLRCFIDSIHSHNLRVFSVWNIWAKNSVV